MIRLYAIYKCRVLWADAVEEEELKKEALMFLRANMHVVKKFYCEKLKQLSKERPEIFAEVMLD
jgi:hypothetical protein